MNTKAQAPVQQHRLRNGLTVRMKEVHTAPIVSVWIWYRVGSRDEYAGLTGVSHWVEHMQFKGTPSFPAVILDREISRDGGYWNAMTWLDWTAYYETLPSDKLDLGLRLEADRMVNSLFDLPEVESERTVIISERQGHENEPTFRLAEEVQAAAFRVHSYHHEIVGDLDDLVSMTRDDLYQHYRRYYIPSNAVLTVAGDFHSQTLLKKIRAEFGALPRVSLPERLHRSEPAQLGERRVVVEGPGETPFLQVSYHAPQADHADFFPLTVLDSVLTGAANLNLFGSGISNKTSRLYRALVEGEIAASVQGGLAATSDPYLYTIHTTIRPDRSPESALEILDREIARVLEEPLREEELMKASKQARALFAFNSESVTNIAFWLGFSEMFADYRWFEEYPQQVEAVTVDDILRVAAKYLQLSNRVVGIYHPQNGRSHD
jgi:zinc protease